MKPLRFLPLVALAAFSLLGLKLADLLTGGGHTLTGTQQTMAQDADAAKKPKEGEAAAKGKDSAKADKAADAKDGEKAKGKQKEPPRDVTAIEPDKLPTESELALLSNLAKRRKELDKRERVFETRQALLKAAEKRIDERIGMLKQLQARVEKVSEKRAEQQKAQYARLVKMYSGMKPKDAARIFNELDRNVLLGLIRQMKPQIMSAILAAMDPQKARDTTIALAGGEQPKLAARNGVDQLPKIQGQ